MTDFSPESINGLVKLGLLADSNGRKEMISQFTEIAVAKKPDDTRFLVTTMLISVRIFNHRRRRS